MGAVPRDPSNPARPGHRVTRRAILSGLAFSAVLASSSALLWSDATAGKRLNLVRKAAKAVAREAAAARAGELAPTDDATPAKPADAAVRPVGRPVAIKPATLRMNPSAAAQEERVVYHYDAIGRRDPFQPLVGGGFVGMDVGGDAPPDVGGIKVVGIVWGPADKFALVEDPSGNSLVLRQGDKVMNGVVESLKRDALVVKLNLDGVSQLITIPVTRKGEQNGNN